MSRKNPSSLVYLLTFLSLVSGISFLCNFPLDLKSLALVSIPRSQTINRENIDRAEHKPSPNTPPPHTNTDSKATEYKPPNRGVPSSTGGGGTRGGNCDETPGNLTALRPDNSLEGGIGLTLESQPKFLVYLPQTSAKTGEFTLKDEQENNVYQAKFPIKGQPGIIIFSLPKNSIQLELNKNYTWYISIICNPQSRTGDVEDKGWIRRKAPETKLANELQNVAARERPKIYAQNSIWHESIANLAELISQNPNDSGLMTDWKTLLKSAGIKEVGDKPFSLTKIELPPN